MRFQKNIAVGLLLLILLVSIGAGVSLKNLKFDYDFESFFPSDDEDLEFYLDFRSEFEPDNDFILIAIENNTGIFEKDFLKDIKGFSKECKSIPNITKVLSPVNLKLPVISPPSVFEIPYLHINDESRYEKDSIRIYKSKNLVGTFFSQDAKSLNVYLQTKPNLSKVKSDSLLVSLNDVLSNYDFEEIHLSGRIPSQQYIIEKMNWELVLFVSISLIILVVVLYSTFKTGWGIWTPLLVVLLTAVWLLGFMVFIGQPLNLITTLLPTILFVVGMSDIVHILSKYLEELRKGKVKIEAIKTTFKEVGFATFLTSLTTAIGFLTLVFSSIKPLKDFGVYTALGVFIAFFLSFTVLPAVLVLNKEPKIVERKQIWSAMLSKWLLFVFRNMKNIVVASVVIFGIAVLGIFNLKIDNYLLEDLKNNDPHKQDFMYFEEHYSGVRPFEMAIWTSDTLNGDLLSFESVKEIEKIESYLVEQYGLGFIMSPLAMIKTINQAMHNGKSDYYRVPESEKELSKIIRYAKKFKNRKEFKSLLANDNKKGRISGKIKDFGGNKIRGLNNELYTNLAKEIDNSIIQYRITGTAMLIDKNSQYLAKNMVIGLLIAFALIALIVGFMFKNVKMVLISLVPNILPLVLIAGIMGFFGIDLKASTSIIFTIAFGIAVDDTIHFLSKLKIELSKGRSVLYAVKRTYISTGKAIMVTSIIICSGFLSLWASSFMSTFYIGVLISFTLLFAVLADLFLLPILIIKYIKK